MNGAARVRLQISSRLATHVTLPNLLLLSPKSWTVLTAPSGQRRRSYKRSLKPLPVYKMTTPESRTSGYATHPQGMIMQPPLALPRLQPNIGSPLLS